CTTPSITPNNPPSPRTPSWCPSISPPRTSSSAIPEPRPAAQVPGKALQLPPLLGLVAVPEQHQVAAPAVPLETQHQHPGRQIGEATSHGQGISPGAVQGEPISIDPQPPARAAVKAPPLPEAVHEHRAGEGGPHQPSGIGEQQQQGNGPVAPQQQQALAGGRGEGKLSARG